METLRTFIAIPLPQPLLEQLAALQQKLEKQTPPRSVRWVRAEGIHLTLKFLGDTPGDRLPAIRQALRDVAQLTPRGGFQVTGLGCFPNMRRPRVVWVGVEEPTGWLARLQSAVERAMAPLGFPPEGRGFSPHLTLGRVSDRATGGDVARVGEIVSAATVGALGTVESASFALIRSVLKPSGAEYTPLAEFTLGGGAA